MAGCESSQLLSKLHVRSLTYNRMWQSHDPTIHYFQLPILSFLAHIIPKSNQNEFMVDIDLWPRKAVSLCALMCKALDDPLVRGGGVVCKNNVMSFLFLQIYDVWVSINGSGR